MLDFMDYVQNAFYEASHWNRNNSYGTLTATSQGKSSSAILESRPMRFFTDTQPQPFSTSPPLWDSASTYPPSQLPTSPPRILSLPPACSPAPSLTSIPPCLFPLCRPQPGPSPSQLTRPQATGNFSPFARQTRRGGGRYGTQGNGSIREMRSFTVASIYRKVHWKRST